MTRQFLLMAGLALSVSAFGATEKKALQPRVNDAVSVVNNVDFSSFKEVVAERNVGQTVNAPARKASGTAVQWKRPAGQFWGIGYTEYTGKWYYITPLVVRPWVDYTFENVSSIQGTPSWDIPVLIGQDPDTGEGIYDYDKSNENSVATSYLYYENAPAPLLSYENQVPYPTMFYGANPTGRDITVLGTDNIETWFGAPMPVSSHYWSLFSRIPMEEGRQGLTYYSGAKSYEDGGKGYWFGTNNQGINAMATRFEKPASPYLLNSVYWYYFTSGAVEKEVPLKAYVFKTANDAATFETQSGAILEEVELGELIAVADAYVPVSEDGQEGVLTFKFVERNPVTGAESEISLEIEDDITVVVTGFNAYLENGTYMSSLASNDDIDEGYGNLGFLGNFDINEDGTVNYGLTALKDFFTGDGLGNTTLGVLADVTYPWLVNMFEDVPDVVKLPNEGTTTEEVQGLQYALYLMSTSETPDFEITYNGEEECEWLSVIEMYDDTELNPNTNEEEFTGMCAVLFQAAPNPNDENRTCKVEITIPAASYTITFIQGSNNTAVEVVGVETNATYYDLQGRPVANPDKGIYIKKAGNKAEKVIL